MVVTLFKVLDEADMLMKTKDSFAKLAQVVTEGMSTVADCRINIPRYPRPVKLLFSATLEQSPGTSVVVVIGLNFRA